MLRTTSVVQSIADVARQTATAIKLRFLGKNVGANLFAYERVYHDCANKFAPTTLSS